MFRKWFLPAICALLVVGSAAEAPGESIFSSLGLGESILPAGGRARGMGGTGISLVDTITGSYLNPAGASLLQRVTVSVIFAPEVRSPKGLAGVSKNWETQFGGLIAVFPFPRNVSLQVGLLVRGNMNSEARWTGESPSSEYLGYYEREGGRSSIPVHLSLMPSEHILIAGGLDFVQLSSREMWSREFPSTNYRDSEDRLEGEFSGARASGSVLLLWPERLALGLVALQGRDLDGTLTTRPSYGKEFESHVSIHLPAAYGAGARLHPIPGWSIAFEGWRTNWGDFRIAGEAPLPDRTSYRIGAGIERVSTRKTGLWLTRLPLRLGYWREPQAFDWKSGVEGPMTERVVTQMATIGTGFPLAGKSGRVDVALEVGRIGSLSINGAEERIARLSICYTASERWQRKRQTRY